LKHELIKAFERRYLTHLLALCSGNVSRAAEMAGKERRDLGRLLKKYGLDPQSFRYENPAQRTAARCVIDSRRP
jgi:DNA-binding NtrC family response regulator